MLILDIILTTLWKIGKGLHHGIGIQFLHKLPKGIKKKKEIG